MKQYSKSAKVGNFDADIACEHWDSAMSYVEAAIAKAEKG